MKLKLFALTALMFAVTGTVALSGCANSPNSTTSETPMQAEPAEATAEAPHGTEEAAGEEHATEGEDHAAAGEEHAAEGHGEEHAHAPEAAHH